MLALWRTQRGHPFRLTKVAGMIKLGLDRVRVRVTAGKRGMVTELARIRLRTRQELRGDAQLIDNRAFATDG